MFTELSLYTGIGGGVLGTKMFGWTTIGYVENDDYCQRVIRQRIGEGALDTAPIFSGVNEFIDQGCCELYRGITDIVTGGFPCQPFSVAGKQEAESDERNLWPQTIDIIRRVRPRFAFLENVRGLLRSGYFGTIIKDLADSGYNARWRLLSAEEVGAPHLRDRLWILAEAPDVAELRSSRWNYIDTYSKEVSNSVGYRLEREQQRGAEALATYRSSDEANPYWWTNEPSVGRVVDGLTNRIQRIRAVGNAQVPLAAAYAFYLLATEKP